MEVERMLLLRIGMGHSWRARRCVVSGYCGLMEGESHGSGLLETDITPCNAIDRYFNQRGAAVRVAKKLHSYLRQKVNSYPRDRGQPNQPLLCCATVLPRCSP